MNDLERFKAVCRGEKPDFVPVIGLPGESGLEKEVINQGNENMIESEVMGKVPKMLPYGRYLPNIDHSLQPICTFQNLCRFMYLLHKVTGNPLGEFRKYLVCTIVLLHILLTTAGAAQSSNIYIPVIEGEWWQVAGNPDLK